MSESAASYEMFRIFDTIRDALGRGPDMKSAASTEDVLRDALMVAADLLQQDGYDRDPDYRQEWQTIKEALGEG